MTLLERFSSGAQIRSVAVNREFRVEDHLRILLKFDDVQQVDCPYYASSGRHQALADHLKKAQWC